MSGCSDPSAFAGRHVGHEPGDQAIGRVWPERLPRRAVPLPESEASISESGSSIVLGSANWSNGLSRSGAPGHAERVEEWTVCPNARRARPQTAESSPFGSSAMIGPRIGQEIGNEKVTALARAGRRDHARSRVTRVADVLDRRWNRHLRSESESIQATRPAPKSRPFPTIASPRSEIP